MQIKETGIKGLDEIFPRIIKDERGIFFEAFHEKALEEAGVNGRFVQDNQSFSKKGVLRGLHLQKPPYSQGKLVRVITGSALDIAVDCRKGSPTFGQWESVVLDSRKHNMLYIPEGFAHGFVALEDTIFFYKCTNYYHKASETGIIWNDKTLNINWKVDRPIVSEKDKALPTFEDFVNSL